MAKTASNLRIDPQVVLVASGQDRRGQLQGLDAYRTAQKTFSHHFDVEHYNALQARGSLSVNSKNSPRILSVMPSSAVP